MQKIRLKVGYEDKMGGGMIWYKEFIGQCIVKYPDPIAPEEKQFDVYKEEKGLIFVHVIRTARPRPGLIYELEEYKTKEKFFSETSCPRELIDKVRFALEIDEAEDIDS